MTCCPFKTLTRSSQSLKSMILVCLPLWSCLVLLAFISTAVLTRSGFVRNNPNPHTKIFFDIWPSYCRTVPFFWTQSPLRASWTIYYPYIFQYLSSDWFVSSSGLTLSSRCSLTPPSVPKTTKLLLLQQISARFIYLHFVPFYPPDIYILLCVL